jgi:hypothetical protein
MILRREVTVKIASDFWQRSIVSENRGRESIMAG